ncbi:MAG: hypothetical protein GY869_24300, partial [Planctomycetes bacterium]|nr:hypothetical protein [Planctomycetota bacterium]
MKRLLLSLSICSLLLLGGSCQVAPTPIDFTPQTVEGIQPSDLLTGPPVVTAKAWAIVNG